MINTQFRQQFPYFKQNGNWTYLDSAATTLKPQILIDETCQFYQSAGSVHRSQYDLSQTQAYEKARDLVAKRFNVVTREAVIWTSGTTHAINIIANGLDEQIQTDDEIIITVAEHHANFVPWQQLAERKHAKLVVLPLNENYQLEPTALQNALSERTKIVALNLVSNVTGVRQPVEALIPIIRQYTEAKVILDIAQAVCSEQVDVQKLDADFYAFSAHKMYGPTGVGVLMGKSQSLAQIKPLIFGGKMLQNVTEQQLTLAELPYRLEAGTPNIAGIIGFGKVLEWLETWDFQQLNQGLYHLATQMRKRLESYPNIQILGNAISPTMSFTFSNQHHADLATILAEQKIALRSGEHCAKPYLRYLSKTGTLRLSLAHYNISDDLNQFFNALDTTLAILQD
ncbi:cysteine desulfurase [Ursidibacter maritimus]|uniref:cysteine desulfurase n=1 Tax=Ursidibacter maritimus TaxID=1331689 RepID=A0A949T3S3_9PAST|nr:cysteine desulfurase [Ursidibacter maritimus]KAE9540466.1 cysteine desulfurase [Ursidibacter maritimus]MBV6524647.1 cysteine desulfurase [Ursidibacter maritimus]MBV6525056.1 cysteine desulfurase [Ursidibacter maritimus]MBV6527258.1 cysteine desulfurase [Ursidibacter maritimus]MBV6530104.1 cysteine desulfurase [Ursidibacter maritimus]